MSKKNSNKSKKSYLCNLRRKHREFINGIDLEEFSFQKDFWDQIVKPQTLSLLISRKIFGGATLYNNLQSDSDTNKFCFPKFKSNNEIVRYVQSCMFLKDSNKIKQLQSELQYLLKKETDAKLEQLTEIVKEIIYLDKYGSFLRSNPRFIVKKDSYVYRAIKLYDGDNLKEDFNPIEWRFINKHQALMRLNKGGGEQPVLYVSPDFNSVFYEVDAEDTYEKMAVFVYRVKDDIQLLPIDGKMFTNPEYDDSFKRYGEYIGQILEPLFSIKISPELNESLVYELSNFIKDEFYNIERENNNKIEHENNNEIDNQVVGWTYISTKTTKFISQITNSDSLNIEHRCFAFPENYYEKVLDLDNVSCCMVNCGDYEKKHLKFCDDSYVQNKIELSWDGKIIKNYH
nr:hypothetical protein [Streptococcus sp. Marseille-Q6470]